MKTLKVQDLMVGDWVVTELGCVIIQLKVDDFKQIECNELIVNPIPLTEEILKVNGWKWRKKGLISSMRLFDEDGHSIMTLTYGNLMSIGGHEIKVQYIHELQRALRCCGLNELADNFKAVPDSVIFNGHSRSTDGCSKTK